MIQLISGCYFYLSKKWLSLYLASKMYLYNKCCTPETQAHETSTLEYLELVSTADNDQLSSQTWADSITL